MNLSSLSSQLNISINDLRIKSKNLGFFIHPRANKIDNDLASRILNALGEKPKNTNEGKNKITNISLPQFIKVRDLADQLNRPVTDVIKVLIKNGVMASINQDIDFDTASLVALEFNVEVASQNDNTETGMSYLETVLKESTEDKVARPPIVAVMGHVDHGKTTLLDSIRKTNVAGGESGGITQHIGAYQITYKDKKITFLDTPGHEAFAEMRARGANITDIIILVVAADDGVRPQTIEVLNRAKFSGIPLIIAINKIDKEGSNTQRILQELGSFGIITESWGGQTIAVEISAKNNIGIDKLLEMILLQSEVMNITASLLGKTAGTVIETKQSQGLGTVASIIVQNGTIKQGDIFLCGPSYGKVKSIEDEKGKKLKIATPGSPVRISGFYGTPEVGDIFQNTSSIEEARTISLSIQKKTEKGRLNAKLRLNIDPNSKNLNLIIKTDAAGSLEAIKQSLEKLKNDEVLIKIISEGIGEVTESDVLLASSSKAHIISFRSKTSTKVESLAKTKKVDLEKYDVIYELIEAITSTVISMFKPEFETTTLGKAKILAVFLTEKNQAIVGGKVLSGKIIKNKPINIIRDSEIINKAEIIELQQNKQTTKEVVENQEFGIKLKTNTKIKEGDILESFDEVLKKKTL